MLGKFFRKPKPDQHFELDLPNVDKDKKSEVAHPRPPTEGDPEIVIPPRKEPLLTPENVSLMAVILLLLLGGLGIWSWLRYDNLSTIRQAENQHHEVVLDSLAQVKLDLEKNLEQLESDFSILRTENDTLANRLESSTNIIAEKELAIQEIKTQSIREESALRAQVQRLQTLKDRYETIIDVLAQKNTALSAENARLRGEADSLNTQISELGRQLEAQIRQTLSAKYKATAFRVEMERRNDKLTLRAKRTRELKVSFDLNNVPAMFQGNQQLYMAITDDKGIPIPIDNPIQATIKTEKGNVAIIAQATRLQNVIENQHILLSYKLDDRLKKGTYIVSVYSEKGLLGVASFRLI